MMTSDRVFDAGLQAERTSLAWRRTGLALLACSLAAGRVLWPALGFAAIALAILGAATGVAVVGLHSRRYQRVHATLTAAGTTRVALPDGRSLALVAVVVVLLAVAALVAAL